MKVFKNGLREAYTIVEECDTLFEVVKILNDYTTRDEAITAAAKLATKKVTEIELLQEYSKKDIF